MSGLVKPNVVWTQTSSPILRAGMVKSPPPGQTPAIFIIFRMSPGNGPSTLPK